MAGCAAGATMGIVSVYKVAELTETMVELGPLSLPSRGGAHPTSGTVGMPSIFAMVMSQTHTYLGRTIDTLIMVTDAQ